jgi:hypothetical protein
MSARIECKRITNHNTPQLSRMDLANHFAASLGLSLLNTQAVRTFAELGYDSGWLNVTKLRSELQHPSRPCAAGEWRNSTVQIDFSWRNFPSNLAKCECNTAPWVGSQCHCRKPHAESCRKLCNDISLCRCVTNLTCQTFIVTLNTAYKIHMYIPHTDGPLTHIDSVRDIISIAFRYIQFVTVSQ